MNERPTPETDAEMNFTDASGWYVPVAFARNLERQRDELCDAWERGQLAAELEPVPLTEPGVRITLQELRNDCADALRQRDELLVALEAVLLNPYADPHSLLWIKARAAIAAVKGGKP